ncbi:MAG: nucleotidyltransferase family protein [Elusimicrobia bacterium]|nr:nucleotidyltransferase family protein [Elusimicrobiota bacterium]
MIDFQIKEPCLRLLCLAASGQCDIEEVARTYRKLDVRALWESARVNDMTAVVAHALMDALDEAPPLFCQAHEESVRRINLYLAELDRVAYSFAQAGISLAALKNSGIARGIYPCAGCCPMGDMDVLVEKRHFRQAHQILLGEGFHFDFRSPLEKADLDAAEKNGGAEYWKELPDGKKLWFELQWRPISGRWIQPDQEPDAEKLLERSVAISGTTVRLLAPEDNLLQVALHTAKHSYVRAPGFRLHMDVDRLVRHLPIQWDVFLNMVIALRVKTPVYFSLAIPSLLFKTPVPAEVLQALAPSDWKRQWLFRWLKHIGFFAPDKGKFSNPAYILFNAMLYDNFGCLWRAAFPSRALMREHYDIRGRLFFPYYLRRLISLAFRRTL